MGLDGSQAAQSRLLGPPTSVKGVESAPLHVCPQGQFTLACGVGWGPSLQHAGASALAEVSSERQGQFSQSQ